MELNFQSIDRDKGIAYHTVNVIKVFTSIFLLLLSLYPVYAVSSWKELDFNNDDKVNYTDGDSTISNIKDVSLYYSCPDGTFRCETTLSPTPTPLTSCTKEGITCTKSIDCCSGLICSTKSNTCQAYQEADTYFTIQVADESFCLYSNKSRTIQSAQDNYRGLNMMHPIGNVLGGSGGFNYGYGGLPGDKYERWWSWHLDPDQTSMADATIEICDGLPSAVEYGPLDNGNYCPWLGKVTAIGCPHLLTPSP